MKKNVNPARRRALMVGGLLAVCTLVMAIPSNAAAPPVGRTYFVVSLGLATDRAEAYEVGAGCVHFTSDEVCDSDGDCGVWWLIEEEDAVTRQSLIGFEFEVVDDETGQLVEILGSGRIDTRGPRSSLAAAAHGSEPASGRMINFAFAGRSEGPRRCERLAAQFAAAGQ